MISNDQTSSQLNADQEIFSCIDLIDAKSFFLFAGAGSGKTRTLVLSLKEIKKNIGLQLRMSRKRVAVITYTNAASDEIKHRVDLDPLFSVSTIHHFVWELIKPFTSDIKQVLRILISEDTAKKEEEQRKGKAGSKAAFQREIDIRNNNTRLGVLDSITEFQYSPAGDNIGRASLDHSEVISLTSYFLTNKPLLQKLLVTQYPILFIDESQDTNKKLIEAFFRVQLEHPKTFTLGLFGDTMQRIYQDGKPDLGLNLPEGWLQPEKTINYRCPARVIKLINQIRSLADGRLQVPQMGQDEGFARLFIVDRKAISSAKAEETIALKMSQITGDENWNGNGSEIKVLILEHHMAASRMGFLTFYTALSKSGKSRSGLNDGTFSGIPFFTKLLVPLLDAKDRGDSFSIMRILKDSSPLLKKDKIKMFEDQREAFQITKVACDSLFHLWNGKVPTLQEIIENIYNSHLFDLPKIFTVIIESQKKFAANNEISSTSEEANEEDNSSEFFQGWEEALKCSFSELILYSNYVADSSRFGTHQGVKGREFERVMVIADDFEARGFNFKYDKLFSAPLPKAKIVGQPITGLDSTFDNTLRLFYVACSRAEKSLAIVAYTDSPEVVKENVLKQSWFDEKEVVIVS